MITILLQKILEQVKELKTNIGNIPTVDKDYSYNEKIVGKWLNGKTVYQKTFSAGSGITFGNITIPLDINNIDKVIYAEGVAFLNSNNFIIFPRVASDGKNCGITAISSSNIVCYVDRAFDRTVDSIYVTIRYTKSEED